MPKYNATISLTFDQKIEANNEEEAKDLIIEEYKQENNLDLEYNEIELSLTQK